jgi:hypothetical protein
MKTTDRIIKNNLRAWYKSASKRQVLHGMRWYEDANLFASELASKSGHSTEKIAGVISALSPRNQWHRNLIDAETVTWAQARKLKPSDVKVSTFHKNKDKAFDILEGKQTIKEKSRKTHSFVKNVGSLDDNYITIDSWHLRACQSKPSRMVKAGEVKESVTPKQYDRIKDLTMEVAKEFNVKGYEFQAIVWVAIKEKTEA